jgi:hypothetical protein
MSQSTMKTWDCEMTERIYHQWTVTARTKKEAMQTAFEGCPSDKCQGESDELTVKEAP